MEQDTEKWSDPYILDTATDADKERCWATKLRVAEINDASQYARQDWSLFHPLSKLTCDYYEEAFRRGWAPYLTPITVYRNPKGGFELQDGWHRLTAAVNTNQEYINAVVLGDNLVSTEDITRYGENHDPT